MTCAMTQMNAEDIMLSEMRQSQKTNMIHRDRTQNGSSAGGEGEGREKLMGLATLGRCKRFRDQWWG